jgi:glycosyltransferase involved in cell wall biosynthesis
MRILFVTAMLPSLASGSPIRTLNLVKGLSRAHSVSIISFLQPFEEDFVSNLEPYCERLELIPWGGFVPVGKWRNRLQGWYRLLLSRRPELVRTFPTESMRKPLIRLIEDLEPDVVEFEGLYLAELIPEAGRLPVVLAQHDVDFEILKRGSRTTDSLVHGIRDQLAWRKLRRFETRWIRRFDVCTVVSPRDAVQLRELSPRTEFHVIPNGVDCDYFAPSGDAPPRDPDSIVFVGTMNYGPNVDGVLYFCREIWPLILSQAPDCRLTIVGGRPLPEVTALQDLPGVTVTGFVEDVRPYFWRAALSIVPLRAGSGTRLKILESLAAGCPVVSTTIGAEGLSLAKGEEILIADTPAGFARAALSLTQSRETRARLAENGRRAVAEHHDWDRITELLEQAYLAVLDKAVKATEIGVPK